MSGVRDEAGRPAAAPDGARRGHSGGARRGVGRALLRLAWKCSLLGALVAVAVVGVFLLPLSDDHSYLLADRDKRAAAARARSPKIVLVGGSNLAFSVDSGLLEARTGRPVVNMGVNAGLGLDYMLAEVAPLLRPGDTVVLAPEYQLLACGCADGAVILSLLDVDRTAAASLDASSVRPVARATLAYVRDKLYRIRAWHGLTAVPFGPPYVREAFDARGDILDSMRGRGESAAGGTVEGRIDIGDGRLAEATRTLLAGFAARADAAGVAFLVAFPPLPEREFRRQERAFLRLESELTASLGSRVISRLPEYVFPDAEFLDTVYHLRLAGRRVRTERLLADLARARERGS